MFLTYFHFPMATSTAVSRIILHCGSMRCVERKTILPYIRFEEREFISLRLGYNIFKYEFTNGNLDKTRDGQLTEKIRDGYANGDLT